MNLLFTGRGTSGSWSIRGQQLGAACEARVQARAKLADCKAADAIVVVKRVDDELLAALRGSGRPWAFDVLDCYPQPACSTWGRSEAIEWVRARIKALAPTALIWPNERMREDCGTDLPSLILPHHHRPGIAKNPIREQVRMVGYEGQAEYLGGWRTTLERECEKRGWQFTASPIHLADLDIVVAMRGGGWESYASRHWKSNVKLANAHGSGTPFVGQQECGYMETSTGCEYWAENAHDLRMCFDWLAAKSTREQVSERFLQRAYTVERAAAQLQAFMRGL